MAGTRKGADRKIPRRRRAEVLDAAARVFRAKGYEAASIQDIADEVGILKGSLYYYITSKEDVLFEMLQEVHVAALEAVVAAVAIDGDPLVKIRAFVETLSRFHAENAIRMGILLHDFRSLGEERRDAIVRERDQYDRILRTLIVQGTEQGMIRPGVDPKVTALAVMGTINSIYHWYRSSGSQRPDHVGRVYADLIVGSLVLRPG